MAVQITPLFAPTVLTGSAAAIYTAPASPTTVAVTRLRVRFTNTTAGPISVTAYAVPSAGSPAAGNCCANAESIAANNHLDLDIPVLGPGGIFEAFASAVTSITVSQLDGVIFS